MNRTERTQLRQLPERGSYDRDVVHSILDAGFLAHVGFPANLQTFVIPMLYGRNGDTLYLHGAAVARTLHELGTGVAACVAVTLVDGFVLARSAFHHSMNYRSVIAFGTCRRLADSVQKTKALRVISEHLMAGRWKDVRGPSRTELEMTSVVEFSIEEASGKTRTGPPMDDEQDYGRPVWAGVVPLQLESKTPIPDPRLPPDVAIPHYLPGFIGR